MAEIRLKENESLESALRRFKKQCARAGVIAEVRKREAYEKPSVKRKEKIRSSSQTQIQVIKQADRAFCPLFVLSSYFFEKR